MEQYCEQSGGQVQGRQPFWNTNGDQAQWLALAGSATMCRFQADDEAKSRIYVDLTTLSSTEPTLAGLAYLSKVPMPSSTGGGNPATAYCSTELNASSSIGGGAAGGGWVNTTDPDDVVVSLCVFPDGSFVDEWGLAYHSAGDVRGKDLATVMKYQPSGALPPVFPTAQVQPTR
jgi:putative hemolysin